MEVDHNVDHLSNNNNVSQNHIPKNFNTPQNNNVPQISDVNNNNSIINNSIINNDKSVSVINNNNKKNSRHIRLMNDVEPYDIIKDLSNINCNISLAQLLDGSPRIRADLIKGLKLERNNFLSALNNLDVQMTIVNNIDHEYLSRKREVNEDDIAIVQATVDEVTCHLLVDSGSNLNIVSSKFFNSLPGEYQSAGISKGRILQALSSGEPSEGQLVYLPVRINFIYFETAFRIIDNDDAYFDILVNYYTQAVYKFFVVPPLKALYCLREDNLSFNYVCDTVSDIEMDKIACFIKKIDDVSINVYNYSNNFCYATYNHDLSPIDFIHSKFMLDHVDEKFINEIIIILEDHIEIIATSTNDLTSVVHFGPWLKKFT